MPTVAITGLLPDEINETFSIKEKFRGKQIFHWISNGVESFSDMSNVPQQLREKLEKEATSIKSVCIDAKREYKHVCPACNKEWVEEILSTERSHTQKICPECRNARLDKPKQRRGRKPFKLQAEHTEKKVFLIKKSKKTT